METYRVDFPLSRTHEGLPLGNGRMGVLVWGEDRRLCLTVSRNDLWDHRGGAPWEEKQNFRAIRDCLERGDEAGLRALFEKREYPEGQPSRPSIVPLGRIDLVFKKKHPLESIELNPLEGKISVYFEKTDEPLDLLLSPTEDVLLLRPGRKCPDFQVETHPAWEWMEEQLRDISFEPPERFEREQATGWVQAFPADPGVGVIFRRFDESAVILTRRIEEGEDGESAMADAGDEAFNKTIHFYDQDTQSYEDETREWWMDYWDECPTIDLPNETLSRMFYLGLYRWGAMTNPHGVAAGLQGPWIEEYAFPPWSSDYHFNINVQMCYWPGYGSGHPEHFRPLWDLIDSWTDRLRENARCFLGIDDGLMLPHAVDDRCVAMGKFWTGAIDHGCTAWVAQMMMRYYRFFGDEDFLRERAWPFMYGAMRVYEEMLEREGDAYVLPVSVSPEYRGNRFNAWGRNASFQLAAIHRLLEDIAEAAEILSETVPESWLEIKERLPLASLAPWAGVDSAVIRPGDQTPRILLWEGQPLEESHRHHSHLAGIYPFDVIDLEDLDWREIIERSFQEWIFRGMGAWSGWCVPWAAILHAFYDNAEMAEFLLELLDRFYTNDSGATVHDPYYPGFSLIGGLAGSARQGNERMQMDAAMAATTAVMEMLVHERRGVMHIFPGAPMSWDTVRFDNIRVSGGFLVSAWRKGGIVQRVEIISEFGGVFRLKNPWDGDAIVQHGRGFYSGDIFEIEMEPGDILPLIPRGERRHSRR